ncbi:MAG TPA: hypothetical protein VFV34_12235 [Blastocatellia bacterium]|nr:hypothetical protein [Blastocatellia bacterium]
MKLLSVEMARVGVFVPIDEVVPLRSIYPPDLANALAERYSFVYRPDWSLPKNEIQAKGMEFQMGKFQSADGEHNVIQNLTVFGLGIVASTASTDVSKEFLHDLFSWADKELGFRFSTTKLEFFYLSQVIAQFDKSLDSIVHSFDVLSNSITDAIRATYKECQPVKLSSVSFDYDRASASEEMKNLSAFSIDRQAGQPFTSQRYFCQAPLPTQVHLRLLERIESGVRG